MESLATKAVPSTVLLASAATGGGPSDPAPTITEPTGPGIIDVFTVGGNAFSNLSLSFFGQGNVGDTAVAKVYLWLRVGSLWYPVQILDATLTLGAAVGVSGDPNVDNTRKFVKNISPNSATTTNLKDLVSANQSNSIASVDLDLHGAVKFEVRLGVTTAVNINALWRTYS